MRRAVLAIGLVTGAARADRLTITPDAVDSDLTCPAARACFNVSSSDEITHVFVDWSFEGCDAGDDGVAPSIVVLVDGRAIPDASLHAQGGPCDHGDGAIAREVWFPLVHARKTAEVCVLVAGGVPSEISVGAKAAAECRAATQAGSCAICTGDDDPSSCQDP